MTALDVATGAGIALTAYLTWGCREPHPHHTHHRARRTAMPRPPQPPAGPQPALPDETERLDGPAVPGKGGKR